jgi:hypothetical protein
MSSPVSIKGQGAPLTVAQAKRLSSSTINCRFPAHAA